MALRKIKGEKRGGYINVRLPVDMVVKLNILAFLEESASGAAMVHRACEELVARHESRINLVLQAIAAAKPEQGNAE